MEYGICKAHRRQADVLFLVWMKTGQGRRKYKREKVSEALEWVRTISVFGYFRECRQHIRAGGSRLCDCEYSSAC